MCSSDLLAGVAVSGEQRGQLLAQPGEDGGLAGVEDDVEPVGPVAAERGASHLVALHRRPQAVGVQARDVGLGLLALSR